MLIQGAWNRTVERTSKLSDKKRDYIRVSDLGKSFLDRWYSMQGEVPTNPYEDRVLRIFDAGNVMEFIVLRALAMAGILHHKQKDVEIAGTDKLLPVYGHLDATIGGFENLEHAEDKIRRHLEEYGLSLDREVIEQKAVQIIQSLKELKTNLPEMVVEVKSINSMAFWSHKNRDKQGNFMGFPHNKLQLYGYMKGTGIEKGILLYISKDDFTLEELGLSLGNQEMEKLMADDIATMSNYWKNQIMPPKEEDIVWNDRKKCYEVNWKIERSIYCNLITGMEKEKWQEITDKKVREMNLELKWRNQAKEHGFNVDGLTTEEIKKMCMAQNREMNKIQKEAEANREGGGQNAK